MSPLHPPPPPDALTDFPSTVLDPTRRLYRVHRREHGAWYFSSAEGSSGRFDLRAPRGTCYAAVERVGAFLEAFQALLPSIPHAEVDVRRISVMRVTHPTRLADCTSELAARHGITGEIHSSADRIPDSVARHAGASDSASGV